MNRFIKLVLCIGFALCISSRCHSQCYHQTVKDCGTGAGVACSGGVCDVWSKNPESGVWVRGDHDGWENKIACSDPGGANVSRPQEIYFTNQVGLCDVYWDGDGPGFGFTNGPIIECKRTGACHCESVGIGNPCLTGAMSTVDEIQTRFVDTTETWCIGSIEN